MSPLSTKGLERLKDRAHRRAEWFKGEGMRRFAHVMSVDMAKEMSKRWTSMRPSADVPDLSPGYKKLKQKRFGHVYPILHATGATLAGMTPYYQRVDSSGGAEWKLGVRWEGTHPKSGTPLGVIALAHIKGEGVPKRDPTAIKEGWSRPWLRRIGEELSRIK